MKVKELNWELDDNIYRSNIYDHIYFKIYFEKNRYILTMNRYLIGHYDTIDLAKKAAENYINNLINNLIEPENDWQTGDIPNPTPSNEYAELLIVHTGNGWYEYYPVADRDEYWLDSDGDSIIDINSHTINYRKKWMIKKLIKN